MSKKKHEKPVEAAPVISEKLRKWQERLSVADREFGTQVTKMDRREALYNGDPTLKAMVPGDRKGKNERTPHVRNIIFENIETF